jgi:alpha-tubulin suppressor-like RCC1 family protein
LQVAAGLDHTCVLLAQGTVRCWGSAYFGQLGYGMGDPGICEGEPCNTYDIGDNEARGAGGDIDVGGAVVQIAAAGYYTCAVLSDGTMRCWGALGHFDGAFSDVIGSTIDQTPAQGTTVDVGGDVTQVSLGLFHGCVLLSSGSVRCFGLGDFPSTGQLGYANGSDVGDDETPASAGDVDIGGKVMQIAAGWDHTCALLEAGNVRCWGAGDAGQLGYGNTLSIGDNETPASAGDVDVGGKVIQISAGFKDTCALLEVGTVRCWGEGADVVGAGWLGYGNTDTIGDNETPASAGDVQVF